MGGLSHNFFSRQQKNTVAFPECLACCRILGYCLCHMFEGLELSVPSKEYVWEINYFVVVAVLSTKGFSLNIHFVFYQSLLVIAFRRSCPSQPQSLPENLVARQLQLLWGSVWEKSWPKSRHIYVREETGLWKPPPLAGSRPLTFWAICAISNEGFFFSRAGT